MDAALPIGTAGSGALDCHLGRAQGFWTVGVKALQRADCCGGDAPQGWVPSWKGVFTRGESSIFFFLCKGYATNSVGVLAGTAKPVVNGAADTTQNAALAPLSSALSQLAALAPQIANLEPACSASAAEVPLPSKFKHI